MEIKTNALRILDKQKTQYKTHILPITEAVSGEELALLLKKDASMVFKTIVTVSKSDKNYVFMLPAKNELDLKKCAVAVGEKSIEMLKSKLLFDLTGYVHGGCSPIGMKKQFVTVIDTTSKNFDSIIFSGGKIGLQVEMNVESLSKVIPLKMAEITLQ